jgi:hypothetical protein
MASTIVFLLVRRVLMLVGLGPKPDDKDVEIAVLRHQLALLHRHVARPRYAPTDRLVLATLARLLPRERWSAFLVTPATLMRWHRELVRREVSGTSVRNILRRNGLGPAPRRGGPSWAEFLRVTIQVSARGAQEPPAGNAPPR